MALLALSLAGGASTAAAPLAPARTVPGDLLVELAKIGQTVDQPGIHAWNARDGWRRLVVWGRRPRWSPDRSEFLFWRDGQPWRTSASKLDPRPLVCNAPRLDEWLEWLGPARNGTQEFLTKAITVQGHQRAWASVGLAVTADDARAVGTPFVTPGEGLVVGAFSASTDGESVAYECCRMGGSLGSVVTEVRWSTVRESRVAERRGGAITADCLAGCRTGNPKWQPAGGLVAFDAIEPLRLQTRTFVYDVGSKRLRLVGRDGLSDAVDWTAAESSQLLCWSPTGDAVLLLHDRGAGANLGLEPRPSRAAPLVAPVGAGSAQRLPGHLGRVVAAAWSPDGLQIAVARSTHLTPWASPDMSFEVWRRPSTVAPFVLQAGHLPPGMQVVDMSW